MSQVLSPGQVLEPAPAPAQEEWRENLNIHIVCPSCNEFPPNLIEDFAAGDTICGSCGLVLGDRIVDTRSEWRTFANDESGGDDPSRVGQAANPLDEGNQLETSIAYGSGDARSRELNRAHQKANLDKNKKNFGEVFNRMATIATTLRIDPNTLEFAKHVYRLASNDQKFKAKNIDAVIAGCLFIACRQTSTPRTFREINNVTQVSKKDIGKTFKMLEDFMKANKQAVANGQYKGQIPGVGDGYKDNKTSATAEDYVDRFCSRLAMNTKAISCSKSIAINVGKVGSLAGKSPLSIAAACIYLASHLLNNAKSPKDIARVAGVSESTIRSSYKLLVPAKDQLIEPRWLEEEGADINRLPAA